MSSLKRTVTLISAAIAGGAGLPAMASTFSSGGLVVLNVGDANGGTVLSSSNSPLSLLEFNTSGTAQNTASASVLALSAPSGTSGGVGLSATASSEGALTLSYGTSPDLILGGYEGTSSSGANKLTSRAAVAVSESGNYTITNFVGPTALNLRGVASTDGQNFYVVAGGTGTSAGVSYVNTSGNTAIANYSNAEELLTYGGNLYLTGQNGSTSISVSQVGAGLPTSSASVTGLAGAVTETGANNIYFANSSTLFVADDGGTTHAPGIDVYLKSGSTWTLTQDFTSAGKLYGLTGIVNGTTVHLYSTQQESGNSSNSNSLISTTFSLGNDTFSTSYATLATSGNENAFRGVQLLPTGPLISLTSSTTGAVSTNQLTQGTRGAHTGSFNPTSPASTLSVMGSGGSYNPAIVTGINSSAGDQDDYVKVAGFSSSDNEIFLLKLDNNGTAMAVDNSAGSVESQIAADIVGANSGISGLTVSALGSAGFDNLTGYNIELEFASPTSVANGDFSFNFDGYFNETASGTPISNVSVTAVAAVPEPASAALLGAGAIGLLGRRRRRHAR